MKKLGLTALVALVLDQLSKWVVVFWLGLEHRENIKVWPPFVNFHMAWNKGVNFGFLGSSAGYMPYALVALSLVIVALVLFWVRKSTDWRAQIAAGLLIGGALGNVIDRLRFGAVADFLNMSCCGIENPYAFNIADITIFLGAIGLIFWAESKSAKKSR